MLPTILSSARAEIVELVHRDIAVHSGQPMVFNGSVVDAVHMCGVVAGGIGVGALAERELANDESGAPVATLWHPQPGFFTSAGAIDGVLSILHKIYAIRRVARSIQPK